MTNNFDPTVNWSDDEVGSTAKLNQMAENDNIVYNMLPHFLYNTGPGRDIDFNDSQSRVLKPTIYAGTVWLDVIGGYGQTKTVSFPQGTFAPGCRPVVMTQIAATGNEKVAIATIGGTDGTRTVKNDGFRVHVYSAYGYKFKSSVHLHYVAFGWQEA